MDEQTTEQRNNSLRDAQIIDSSVLSPSAPEIKPIEPVVPQIQPLALTEPEKEVSATQREIARLQEETVGEAEKRTALEEERGIEEKTQAVTDLEAKLTALTAEARAIPLQLQEEATGRGITKRGLAPLETSRLRTNAIQTLTTQAQLEGARGNLSTALDLVDRAVKAEFDPIREELNAKQANLELLLQSPELSLAEQNRANAQIQSITEQQAQIDKREEAEKAKNEAIVNAVQFGADLQTVKSMQEAETPEEALQIAVDKGFVDDSFILDKKLKEIQIKQAQAQLNVYKKYGGLTPSQYLSQLEKEQAKIKAEEQLDKEAQKEQQQALEDALILDTSITQIDSILNSSALDTVVGGTFLTRGMGRQKEGFIGKTASFIKNVATAGSTSGLFDEISGNADDTVALTQQILDQQFLDKLIAVKSKGATFGALSDNEGQALRNAANAIANTAIKDKSERVIGYDMSQKEFSNQMEQIKTLMNLARQRAIGEVFTNDEKDLLDTFYGETVEFNPAF